MHGLREQQGLSFRMAKSVSRINKTGLKSGLESSDDLTTASLPKSQCSAQEHHLGTKRL